MTLAQLLDKLDWTPVDQDASEWLKTHETALAIEDADREAFRRERVTVGLQAVGVIKTPEPPPPGCWHVLPQAIKTQLIAILEEASDEKTERFTQFPGASDPPVPE